MIAIVGCIVIVVCVLLYIQSYSESYKNIDSGQNRDDVYVNDGVVPLNQTTLSTINHPYFTPSDRQCRQRCSTDESCIRYNFDPISSNCILYNTSTCTT